MPHILFCLSGSLFVAVWSAKSLMDVGVDLANGVLFLEGESANHFDEFTAENVQHFRLRPGQCAWIPAGWQVFSITSQDGGRNTAILQPYLSSGLLSRLPDAVLRAVLLWNMDWAKAQIDKAVTCWSEIGPGYVSWLKTLLPDEAPTPTQLQHATGSGEAPGAAPESLVVEM